MTDIKPANYVEGIHKKNYTDVFEEKLVGAEQMVADCGRVSEPLDGFWHYGIDQYDTCLRGAWYKEERCDAEGRQLPLDYSFDEWPVMRLPCCWNTQLERLALYEGNIIFTRRFRYTPRDDYAPGGDRIAGNEHVERSEHGEHIEYDEHDERSECVQEPARTRVFLKIGAASGVCRVFLNGSFLGMHRGGFAPFYMDATDMLAEDNRIIITVDNTRGADQVPTGNTDWFNYGGIYRSIELIRVNPVFIKTLRVHLIPDGCFDKIAVRIELSEPIDAEATLTIRRTGNAEFARQESKEIAENEAEGQAKAQAELMTKDLAENQLDNELARCTISVSAGAGECVVNAAPELWSPDDPVLYDVEATCRGDKVTDAVGFREIAAKGHALLLNGKPLYLRGISCHEESAANGRSLTDEEREENVRIAKELGCNFMRLAHYPHSGKMSKLCDRLGLLLWEEIPVYWAIDFTNPATFRDAQNQLDELIRRDYNRASVIIWSVGNENPDSDARLGFMGSLAMFAHMQDRTRLVSAACFVDHETHAIADRLALMLDVIGINEYCGWYTPGYDMVKKMGFGGKPQKPVIISEFGADARAGHHGTLDDLGTEEYQEEVYRRQLEIIRDIPFVCGLTPWIFYDFRCPRRLHYLQDYYNTKGLLTADKTVRKKAFYVLQSFYRNMP